MYFEVMIDEEQEAKDQTVSHQPPSTYSESSKKVIETWILPGDIKFLNRPSLWILAACALGFIGLAIVSIMSFWNYFDISFPVSDPTTNISSESPNLGGQAYFSGELDWVFSATGALTTSPVIAGSRVYITSGQTPDSGMVVALDLQTGSVVWEERLNDISDHSPVVAAEFVFVVTRSGDVHALDRNDGATIWSYVAGSSVTGVPIVEEGVIYLTAEDVLALDAATGSEIWNHNVGGAAVRSLELIDGVLIALSSDGNLNLIDSSNGKRRLTFPLWFGPKSGPVAHNGIVVVTGDRGYVLALKVEEKDIPFEKAMRYWWTKFWMWDMAPRPPLPRGYLWQRRDIGGMDARMLGANKETVYLSVNRNILSGSVVALDIETGADLWERTFDAQVARSAIMNAETVVLVTSDGAIYGLDSLTGYIQWQISVQSPLLESVAYGDGRLLIPTFPSELNAIK